MNKIFKTSLAKRKKHREYMRLWDLKNPGKQKEYSLRKKLSGKGAQAFRKSIYGITKEQYNERLKDQKNCCKTCKRDFSLLKKGPHVDHDRNCCSGTKSCGKCVRGLLCQNCNLVLGLVKENIKTLNNLILYTKGLL